MLPVLLEDVVVFPFLLLPVAHVSVLAVVSNNDLYHHPRQKDSRLLRCARRFCIRLRSMASGSVRGPVLVADDVFAMMYIIWGRNFECECCRGVLVQSAGRVGCSELMN